MAFGVAAVLLVLATAGLLALFANCLTKLSDPLSRHPSECPPLSFQFI
jgi:hypothetical protein